MTPYRAAPRGRGLSNWGLSKIPLLLCDGWTVVSAPGEPWGVQSRKRILVPSGGPIALGRGEGVVRYRDVLSFVIRHMISERSQMTAFIVRFFFKNPMTHISSQIPNLFNDPLCFTISGK